MIFARWSFFLSCALGGCLVSAPGHAASTDEWPAYGHDAGNMRHSPLRQITPANVDRLTPAWTFHMRPASLDVAAANRQSASPERGRPAGRYIGSEMTPLVVKGLMILATPYRRVVALNPPPGKQVWAYALAETDAPESRGVSYWPGG